jgi:hypothetical protein
MKLVKSLIAAFVLIASCFCQASAFGGGVKEEFHQSYKLSAGGSIRLNNINGGVEIKVWDKDEVKVDAIKHADDKEALDELNVVVDASSDLVDIDTKYPEGEDHHGLWVEYTITVPKDANLEKIETINGDIDISGVEGKINASTINGTVDASSIKNDCHLETVNGKIEAKFVSLKSVFKGTMKSVNGSIVASLPASASAKIKANTVSGRISNDFGLESSRENDEHSFVKIGDSINGKIGDGGAYLDMENVNGSIKILKSGEDK